MKAAKNVLPVPVAPTRTIGVNAGAYTLARHSASTIALDSATGSSANAAAASFAIGRAAPRVEAASSFRATS